MTWLTVLGWLKDHWKAVWGVGTGLLILTLGGTCATNSRLQGQLEQCLAAAATQGKELDASANMVTKLEAEVKAKCSGNVDVEVTPPTAGGNPCPKVVLKAAWDGSTWNSLMDTARLSATAHVVEKPGPGLGVKGPDAWALSLGGGMSVGGSIYHGSAALDYHALRAYGLLDTTGTWAVGAQAKVLTWNWP